jgi:hypothetical protein
MAQILAFLFGLVGLKSLKKALLLPLGIFLAGTIFTFYFYLITTLVKIYNVIQSFLDYTPQTDSFISLFYSFLNVVGVIDGFNAGLPFIFSSLTFCLMYILYQHTVEIIKTIFFVAKTFVE